MTETTREIFESHQVRKTKKQRAAFRAWLMEKAEAMGYSVREESGSFGVRNVVVGDPDTARVVFGAHYDTCARLPFPNFITPKNFSIYLLYQLAISVVFMILPAVVLGFGVGLAMAALGVSAWEGFPSVISLIMYAWLLVFLVLMLFGPANRHTANDNTSGVTTLLDTMAAMPEAQRARVAFVFFDLEEAGLFGSSAFAKAHKTVKKDTLLVNFDCVSDGEHILVAMNKGARGYSERLKKAFEAALPEGMTVLVTDKAFYPSDQKNFRAGVGVATLRRGRGGLLYMSRIHTPRDTVYREENVAHLAAAAVRLTAALTAEETAHE